MRGCQLRQVRSNPPEAVLRTTPTTQTTLVVTGPVVARNFNPHGNFTSSDHIHRSGLQDKNRVGAASVVHEPKTPRTANGDEMTAIKLNHMLRTRAEPKSGNDPAANYSDALATHNRF